MSRSLPDEQSQLDDDEERDKLPQAYEDAREIAQELSEVERATQSKNVIMCQVKSIDSTKKGGSMAITVDIPGRPDEEETFIFKRPKVWSTMYEFVRFVEHYGYNTEDFHNMILHDVKVKVREVDSGYELVVPDTRRTRIRQKIGLRISQKWVPLMWIAGIVIISFAGAAFAFSGAHVQWVSTPDDAANLSLSAGIFVYGFLNTVSILIYTAMISTMIEDD